MTILDDTGSHHGPDIARGVETLCVDLSVAHASYGNVRSRGEAIAHAMLALRHVEDAIHRLGQAQDHVNAG